MDRCCLVGWPGIALFYGPKFKAKNCLISSSKMAECYWSILLGFTARNRLVVTPKIIIMYFNGMSPRLLPLRLKLQEPILQKFFILSFKWIHLFSRFEEYPSEYPFFRLTSTFSHVSKLLASLYFRWWFYPFTKLGSHCPPPCKFCFEEVLVLQGNFWPRHSF